MVMPMSRIKATLAKLGGFVVALVVGVVLALLWRRNPVKQVANERRAIDRAAALKTQLAEQGAVIARRNVEAEHAEAIRKFDDKQRAKADRLRADPVALNRWLDRLSE